MFLLFAHFVFSACSTSQLDSVPPLPEQPMPYVSVAHPDGLDWVDLKTIFLDKTAPPRASLQDCEINLTKLLGATQIRDEWIDGARELVRARPDFYHWCFYSKLLDLDETLKKSSYIDEKQKLVIKTFSYLVPLAKAFQSEFQDTRYMRWAISRYRRLSENVFYRRVELTPQMSQELAMPVNPFGLVRPPTKTIEEGSVLGRYGIIANPETINASEKSEPERVPAMSSLNAAKEELPNEERVAKPDDGNKGVDTSTALDPAELKEN